MTHHSEPAREAVARGGGAFALVMVTGEAALRFVWRARAVSILRKAPFGWGYREAWQYAGSLYHLFLEEGFSPAEAIECDRQYWED